MLPSENPLSRKWSDGRLTTVPADIPLEEAQETMVVSIRGPAIVSVARSCLIR